MFEMSRNEFGIEFMKGNLRIINKVGVYRKIELNGKIRKCVWNGKKYEVE